MGILSRRLCRLVSVTTSVAILTTACSDEVDIADLPREVPPEFTTTTSAPAPDINGPNVLLIIADDLGVDVSPCYATDAVSAPTIEALCSEGIVFEQAWSMPTSSPTRASILTGRYGYRTGIGDRVQRVEDAIALDEFTMPMAVDEAGLPHETGSFGKWHLGESSDYPNVMGWDYFSGFVEGDLISYEVGQKVVNGVARSVDAYVTTDQVDDAIDWLSHRDKVPWLLWLAFSAPHTPFHVPPADLHEFGDLSDSPDDIEANPRVYYDAALQALDTELGRLIASIEPEVLEQTTIIFVGDNGSPGELHPPRFDEEGAEIPPRAKGTLYEGGIHIPLIVAGTGTTDPGRRSMALVHTVDLFATILDLLGTSSAEVVPGDVAIDSVSLIPLLRNTAPSVRDRLYAELFGETLSRRLDGATTRDDRYKVIRYEDGTVEAYDLLRDPLEERDIWADATGEPRTRLHTMLAEIDAVRPFLLIEEAEPPAEQPETETETDVESG